ncbi:protein lethal(2)essential for life-like [Anthonomus grandis grandis]|uniref:protein lethal(2)essential for life-like n=1 Tax=Anthonomus grandis grandis TaxID=2921223 RepID=UPI002165D561|nr:protein lethal(2)essential for life-like [Anthonomus grandis grandis]
MSLIPLMFGDFEPMCRPSRILEQHFGLGLDQDDLFQPLNLNNKMLTRTPAGYLRNWRPNAANLDSGSTVHFDKDKFQANLDVQQFKPEEITVKVTGDNVLTVEGKHEEKQDQHGYVSRHFVRRYVLPKNCQMDKIESKLSSDGVLTITAPTVEKMEIEHKSIPITQTGEPAKQQKAVEQKK